MEIDVTELVEALRAADWVHHLDIDGKEIHVYAPESGSVDWAYEYARDRCRYRMYVSDERHYSTAGYIRMHPKADSIDSVRYDPPTEVGITVTGETAEVETSEVEY